MFCAVCCPRFSSQMANRPYLSKGCDFFPSFRLSPSDSGQQLCTPGGLNASDNKRPEPSRWPPHTYRGIYPPQTSIFLAAPPHSPAPLLLPDVAQNTFSHLFCLFFLRQDAEKMWEVTGPIFFCTFFFTSYIFAPPLLPRPQPVFVFECVSTPQLSIRLRVKKMDARVTFCLVRRRVSTSPNWSTLECCDTAAVVGRPIGSKGSQRERSGSTGGRQDQHRIYMFVVFFPFLPPSLLVSWVCLMPSDDSEQHLQEISIPFPVIPWTRAGIPLDTRREIKSATSQR